MEQNTEVHSNNVLSDFGKDLDQLQKAGAD